MPRRRPWWVPVVVVPGPVAVPGAVPLFVLSRGPLVVVVPVARLREKRPIMNERRSFLGREERMDDGIEEAGNVKSRNGKVKVFAR